MLLFMLSILSSDARAEFCPRYDGFVITDLMGAVLGYMKVPEEPEGVLLPGNEYWRWLVGPSFPDSFEVSGLPGGPPASAWMGPMELYPHGSFDIGGLQGYQRMPIGPGDRFYRIDVTTDDGVTRRAGWMHRDAVGVGFVHTWYGDPNGVVQDDNGDYLLSAFGTGAVIRFSVAPQPPNGFQYAPLVF